MVKHKGIRLAPVAIAFVFLCSTLLAGLTAPRANANVSNLSGFYYTDSLYKDLSKHQHYWWLYSCFRNADIGRISAAQLNNWDFFQPTAASTTPDAALGAMYDTDGQLVSCDNETVVKTAAGYLGKTDPRAFYCGLTGSTSQTTSGLPLDASRCNTVEPASWDNSANGSSLANDYKNDVGGDPPLTSETRYMRAYASLMQGCEVTFDSASQFTTAAAALKGKSGPTWMAIPVVTKANNGTYTKAYKTGKVGNQSFAVIVVANSSQGDTPWSVTSCSQLRDEADANLAAYQQYLNQHKDEVISSSIGADTGSGGGSGTADPVCQVDGFGWVICPLINTMGDVVDAVADFLDDYLRVEPLTLNTSGVLYKGWGNLLGIANILLILAFMFIIFSQATSVGISSYGVKKMLPKIIAAAIMINISYFICAVLVDISNIAGAGIADLIYSNLGSISDNTQEGSPLGGFKKIAGGITAGLVGASGLIVVAFFFLVPAMIAILSIFIVIAARSAIITLLIIISPLAFAAWVLPNTEKYFKKWWDIFIQMLVVYPAIMAIFAASSAAAVIVADGSGVQSSADEVTGNLFPLLIGLLIQTLPLFALPALIKLSSGVLGRLQGLAQTNIKKSGGDRLGQYVKDRSGVMAKEQQARLAEKYGRDPSGNPYTGAGRFRRTKTALGRATGMVASAPLRKIELEDRKSNAEQAFKTQYAERQAMDHDSSAAKLGERKFELEQRGVSASKEHQAALATTAQTDHDFALRAAGVSGEAGVLRVQASAYAKLREAEMEELGNNKKLLIRDAEQAKMTVGDYTKQIAQYAKPGEELEIGERTVKVTSAMFEAAIDQVAESKNVQILEDLRGKTLGDDGIDQAMISRVIERHDGAIKSAGGFHIATQPDLARGEKESIDKWQQRMTTASLITLSQSAATDVGNMKFAQFMRVATVVRDDPTAFGTIEPAKQENIKVILRDVMTNPQARSNAGDRMALVVDAAMAHGVEIPEDLQSLIGASREPVSNPVESAADATDR